MAMEILGFLIIVGLLIVFIIRRDGWGGAATGRKADEVEEASVKMRLQMEHTMNTLITQMDSRIHQIEGLVAAADERARALEKQLAAVREEQAKAQRKAEQEFAAMRAAHSTYYPPREERYAADYGEPRRGAPSRRVPEGYRGRRAMQRPRLSMEPIGEVSAVRGLDYAAMARRGMEERGGGFAAALSASMHETGQDYGSAPRGTAAGYADYADDYESAEYAGAAYREEAYPQADRWEQYAERPGRGEEDGNARALYWASAAPAEIAVEETPAVIVDPRMRTRRGNDSRERPKDEEPAFTPEQLEELARTEAEVVVSSSVADVVNWPMRPDEEEETAYGEAGDDAGVFAEEEEEPPIEEDAPYMESEEDATPEAMEEPEEDMQPEDMAEEENALPAAMEEEETATDEEPAEAGREEALAGETDAQPAQDNGQDDAGMTDRHEADVEPDAAAEGTTDAEVDEGRTEAAVDMGTTDAGTKEEDDAFGEEREELPESADVDGERLEEDVPAVMRQPSLAVRARALLEQGMTPAEVARETGMGRGAVDLLAQMVKQKGGD